MQSSLQHAFVVLMRIYPKYVKAAIELGFTKKEAKLFCGETIRGVFLHYKKIDDEAEEKCRKWEAKCPKCYKLVEAQCEKRETKCHNLKSMQSITT